jgi:hypothetical protein
MPVRTRDHGSVSLAVAQLYHKSAPRMPAAGNGAMLYFGK